MSVWHGFPCLIEARHHSRYFSSRWWPGLTALGEIFPGESPEPVPQPCTEHLAPAPRPAPSSCDYPKHWSILHLHSDVRNLIWQDFLPASPFWKGFLLLPSSSRANTCLLLRCSELCLRHSMAQGRSSAALTWFGWNKGGLVTSHPTISLNFIKTDPLWKAWLVWFWVWEHFSLWFAPFYISFLVFAF